MAGVLMPRLIHPPGTWTAPNIPMPLGFLDKHPDIPCYCGHMQSEHGKQQGGEPGRCEKCQVCDVFHWDTEDW